MSYNKNQVVIIIIVLFFYIAVKSAKNDVSQKHFSRMNKCMQLIAYNAFDEASACIAPHKAKNPENINVRYYNGIVQYFLNNLEESKEDLTYVLENEKRNQEFITNAKEYLKHIDNKKRLKRQDIGDYYAQINQIVLWENPRSIRVYIHDDYSKGELIKQAFVKWDRALHGMVNFLYVDNPDEAQIIAIAVKRDEIVKSSQDAIGLTTTGAGDMYYYKNNPNKIYRKKALVQIAINYDNHRMVNDKAFFGITLHEIGHALGIGGHSPGLGDAMYFSTDGYIVGVGEVSNRDINTIKRIYGNLL